MTKKVPDSQTEQQTKNFNLNEHLPYRIAVVSNLLLLNRDWQIRELSDLEPRELRVLINIGTFMPIKSADIAYQSKIDSYNVSRAVKVLLAKDFIEVHQDPKNRKIKNLKLNDKGVAVYKRLVSAMEARSTIIEEVLSDMEKASFFNMLNKIENKTEEFLALQAINKVEHGQTPPADQKEIIRWYRKSRK